MCLAVPAKILQVNRKQQRALVDYLGIKRWVGIYLVPDAAAGEYVIIHAGEAISTLDESESRLTLLLWEEYHAGREE